MPTSVVTGAAGFVGSNLVERLLKTGHTVRGVDDFTTGRSRNLDPVRANAAFTLHERDIVEDDLTDVLEDAAYRFHQAAVPSVPRTTIL